MLVELLAQQPHRRPTHPHSLESRLHPDGSDVPVGLIQIVSGEDRSKVQEAIGVGRVLRRRVQGPGLWRQSRSHAVAGFDGGSDAKYAISPSDPGDPRPVEGACEHAVEHLQADERIVRDSHPVRIVPQRPSGHADGLCDLIGFGEPENL